MSSTDAPDPLLQQVPLIRNPAFRPPRPITLNADYGNLLSTMPGSVLPPKPAVDSETLSKWISDLQTIETKDLSMEKRDEDIAIYTSWLSGVQRKVAPGFNFDVMSPTKNE